MMIDVGQIFGDNVETAAARLPMLEQIGVVWLEELFHTSALDTYAYPSRKGHVKLAGGEGARIFNMSQYLIDYGRLG